VGCAMPCSRTEPINGGGRLPDSGLNFFPRTGYICLGSNNAPQLARVLCCSRPGFTSCPEGCMCARYVFSVIKPKITSAGQRNNLFLNISMIAILSIYYNFYTNKLSKFWQGSQKLRGPVLVFVSPGKIYVGGSAYYQRKGVTSDSKTVHL